MVRTKIAAAFNRMYNRVFVCMKCNSKIKTDMDKVKKGKVKCRNCGYKGLRPKRKESKKMG